MPRSMCARARLPGRALAYVLFMVLLSLILMTTCMLCSIIKLVFVCTVSQTNVWMRFGSSANVYVVCSRCEAPRQVLHKH